MLGGQAGLLQESGDELRLPQLNLEIAKTGLLQAFHRQRDDLRVGLGGGFAHQLHAALGLLAQEGGGVGEGLGGGLQIAQPQGERGLRQTACRHARCRNGGIRPHGEDTSRAVEGLPYVLGPVAPGAVIQRAVVLQDGGLDLLVPLQGEQAAQPGLQLALAGALAGEGILHARGDLKAAAFHGETSCDNLAK